MKVMPKSPLFILGYPRSGTTLLRALLGAHPQVYLFDEPDIIQGMRSAGFTIQDRLSPDDRARLLKTWGVGYRCGGDRHLSTLAPEVISGFTSYKGDMSFREVYEWLLPKPEGVPVWGEKSLRNAFYVRDLHELYPNALFVHLVRDPRAVLLSYYRKRHPGTQQPPRQKKAMRFFAFRSFAWCAWLNAVKEVRELLGEDKVIQVRYEDLVTQPEVELRRICDALGLDFDPAMLDETQRKKDRVLTSDAAWAHKKLAEPVDPARASASADLPRWASYIIERSTGERLKELGYAPRQGHVGAPERFTIGAWLYFYQKKVRDKIQKMGAELFGEQGEELNGGRAMTTADEGMRA
jgi:hypothetical protein